MTDSPRVEAAARAIHAGLPGRCEPWEGHNLELAAAALAAADEAEPMVSEAESERAFEQAMGLLTPRLERAEAAARDFAMVLRGIERDKAEGRVVEAWMRLKRTARNVLARHPEYSEES